ncbi:MAG: Hsp20/alpha crystallin family protein [Bacteriovoracaceae bacterium]|nr:Hsp20/alpha crystallin family protein [Bacteriovoracaceae bacterium]
MKVEATKSQIDQNKSELNKLIRSQRGEIAARQQELKNIDKIYQKKTEDKRYQGEVQLMDLQERNINRLKEASSGKEEKLEEIKKQVLDTQERLINEEAQLKKGHSAKLNSLNVNHSEKARDIIDRSQEEIKDLNFDINNKVKSIQNDTSQSLEKIRQKSKLTIDKVAHENGLKVTEAQNGQSNALKISEARFQASLRQGEMDHKSTLTQQQLDNQNDILTKERIHKDRAEATKMHYNELIKGEKEAFESKYKTMITEHETVLNRLKEKFSQQLKQTIESKATAQKALDDRQSDDFYHLKTLEPRIREDESNYYVEIEAPAHEKENFNLTADKRTVRLSFNRRSEKRLDEEGGGVQTTRKSETLTKEFKLKDIVDDKDLKVAYKDGVLSYLLPKA